MARNVQFTRPGLKEVVVLLKDLGIEADFHIDADGNYICSVFGEKGRNVGGCKEAHVFFWGAEQAYSHARGMLEQAERIRTGKLIKVPTVEGLTAAEMVREMLMSEPEAVSRWIKRIWAQKLVFDRHKYSFRKWTKWLTTHEVLTGKHFTAAVDMLVNYYSNHMIVRQ